MADRTASPPAPLQVGRVRLWQPSTILKIALEVKRDIPIQARDYAICVSGTEGASPVEINSPGWNFSKILGSDFCYAPQVDTPSLVYLPQLVLTRAPDVIQISVHRWKAANALPTPIFDAIWVLAEDPEIGHVRVHLAK